MLGQGLNICELVEIAMSTFDSRVLHYVVLSSGRFHCTERSVSSTCALVAEMTRCVEFFKMSSGWFNCTEPSLRTFYGGSKVCRVLIH